MYWILESAILDLLGRSLGLSKPSDVEIDCTALLDDMLDGGILDKMI